MDVTLDPHMVATPDGAAGAAEIGTLGVLIVDDEPIFRLGLRAFLTEHGGELVLVGEASDAEEGLRLALAREPAVILLNAGVPGLNGLQTMRDFRRRVPGARIIVVTPAEDDESVFYAVKYGAAAHLLKTVTPQELLETMRRVAAGEYPIDTNVLSRPALAAQVLTSFRDLGSIDQRVEPLLLPLSPREIEVLDWIAKGTSNKKIGYTLAISDQTVKNHITSILRKLAVNDRTHAVVFALRQGWITG